MSLIISVSGIRGTIGGVKGENLSTEDIVKFSLAFGKLLLQKNPKPTVVLGRDARISGEMVSKLVEASLQSLGVGIIDAGLSTTPSIEMAVLHLKAAGGIILTASHNPREWNALKLLNHRGEFISAEEGLQILELSNLEGLVYADIDNLGQKTSYNSSIEDHIRAILAIPYLPIEKIQSKKYHIVADCINSTGSLALPRLFDSLGCTYELINSNPDGNFRHNPEPLEGHLSELMQATKNKADLGIAVDPDVDRLALVDHEGQYFGEEYSLICCADFMLDVKPGNTVSNLSSSRALADLTLQKGGKHYSSAVGEVHVVNKMKEVNAVIGGEGNGGIILPDLHFGRDSLIGIVLVLANMATKNKTLSQLKSGYPLYYMHKDKINIDPTLNFEDLLKNLSAAYSDVQINLADGLKIDFKDSWLHLRKSNTEPIIRIYSEAKSEQEARILVEDIKIKIEQFN
ncbi:MAG: phosphoglucosamine mutase [Saprospiraceae bacterium]|nr:phosphoglucosamine mutase [Candidatus Vicinibacter affinis]